MIGHPGNLADFYNHINTIAKSKTKRYKMGNRYDLVPEHPDFDTLYNIHRITKSIHDGMWVEYMRTHEKWIYI